MPLSYLPSSILAWLNDDHDDFMYTKQQVAKFPFFHLEARSWYLDCSESFVSKAKEVLSNSLVDMAPMEPAPLEELEEVQPQTEPANNKATKAVKGKGKKAVAQATQASQAQVTTRSASKASAQPSTALAATSVDSPFVVPSIAPSVTPSTPVPVLSQSEANAPYCATQEEGRRTGHQCHFL